MIKKVLVANRGEIAMRIFRTCRVMNIPTVAIYTLVDRGALHVRYAEEAYCISKDETDTSYLKPDLILEIAKKTGSAIHPGYGFLSENADFARRCEEEGVVFIGPSADIIARMGIKTEARKIMQAAGVPVVPGTEDTVNGIEEVKVKAKEIGYPIMLKASAGGGGKGMRLVRDESELEAAFRMSRSEAAHSFGDDSIYIEKYIENPHHIEVQVLGDKYGNVIHLFERECSIQRRNQKVIEESPSPFVKEETRRKMLDISVQACKKIGYYSAGTLEFMMDKDQNFYFLEMNTRLQVEHPVTEECTGVDLVRDMILVASGSRLPYKQEDIVFRGAAIECRIYAEDPANNFMPSPGVIRVREAPEGRNVRLDSAAYAGFEVSLHYDPMIAKLCSWGRNRESAISNMIRALREYKILGIKTTIPFHLRVLHNKTFLKGNYDTTFIDTKFDKEDLNRRKNSDPTVAIIAAALKHFEEQKEAAARATTVPLVGESLWKHYGKLQMSANNF
jgi:acetyl-CoA carboxylase biotin carboxylase subunit